MPAVPKAQLATPVSIWAAAPMPVEPVRSNEAILAVEPFQDLTEVVKEQMLGSGTTPLEGQVPVGQAASSSSAGNGAPMDLDIDSRSDASYEMLEIQSSDLLEDTMKQIKEVFESVPAAERVKLKEFLAGVMKKDNGSNGSSWI